MRKYDVYVSSYISKSGRTSKAKHSLVQGRSLDSVKNTTKRNNPNSVVHVFVHY